MADNLRRRELGLKAISDLCVLCGKEMESIDHLFIHCKFSHSLRCSLLRRCGVLSGRPGSLAGTIQAWRYSSFSRSGLILCRPTPFAILWLTWKERNDRVFIGSLSSVEYIS
eukprot:TRINITY_DN10107_c0_g1_i2.p1 TRINITY_DN10107_c0_g1~~TRINITY_DN10107_c0_g1_i2.p1  ORF type:complete len:112 (-),score=12.99 TRINITY_DN10107_c0_g1_i2:315-650(-)